jgi:hypothetical protein
MLRPINRAKMRDTQARLAATLTDKIPEPVNRAYALALGGDSILRFRNRVFRVPPISYPAGLRLQVLHVRLRKVASGANADGESDASLRELLAVLDEAARLCWSLCRPVSLWDRLFWRWLGNPFLGAASIQELGEIVGFFFECRTRSTVRLQPGEAEKPHVRSISRTNSRSSSNTTAARLG